MKMMFAPDSELRCCLPVLLLHAKRTVPCSRVHVDDVSELGKYLLLSGKESFLEAVGLAFFVGEGFICPRGTIAAIENHGSVVDYAGEHQHGKIQTLLAADRENDKNTQEIARKRRLSIPLMTCFLRFRA